eukprot:462281_1
MGTICFPFTDDPDRIHTRKRLNTPIPINSAFLKGYHNNKIVSSYINSITAPNNMKHPSDDISQLCVSYYSDTINFVVHLKDTGDIVDTTKQDSQIYNVRGYEYSRNGSRSYHISSSEEKYIFFFSKKNHVNKPLLTKNIRSCGVYFESYCHELGIHIKNYQQRRVPGKSDWAPHFNDNIIVAIIPKKDKIQDIFDQLTWTLYMDIHYLGYNHFPAEEK